MDLRVEDHPKPLEELRRLVDIHRAYDHMNKGDLAMEHNDIDAALREYGAAEAMFPDNLEMKFWHAVSLANAKRVDQSLPIFKEIFSKDMNWAVLVPRLQKSALLPDDPALIRKILSVTPEK
jgi:tetratricopeptide (TPR) repeat protein